MEIKDKPAMLMNNPQEEKFLTDCLTPEMRVLEFGSGQSTLVLASLVREVVSIEHHQKYADMLTGSGNLPANVTLCFVPQNREPTQDYDDGTYADFKDYVLHPRYYIDKELFDVVFVDGRARVACATYAAREYLKPGGLIFIHDYRHPKPQYRRKEYEPVENFLERVGQEFAMAKFIVKPM